ncbi:hypothetical protein TTHERM_00638860 (macronuclear) [Tetrahymena thermophila SB210]|uniref:Kinase domain protein n=1 Tax=Tetrahymena thermophila (strain SB210) TaxID=312017 RepID=Q23F47_TETTS|nr:hypothetical protein TTHERM_00638860 [Tetrahymena thermophila SB210]EAR95058.1 hypothetical protein TTHERM_00638860 [Tetrahymena thermophila SB210]|eukprot:XP_001015303.1 hypothetical protein TTHERM_00638860 [Tetrahymena thermophila SB210]
MKNVKQIQLNQRQSEINLGLIQNMRIYLSSYISQCGFGCVFEYKYNEQIVAVKYNKVKKSKKKKNY